MTAPCIVPGYGTAGRWSSCHVLVHHSVHTRTGAGLPRPPPVPPQMPRRFWRRRRQPIRRWRFVGINASLPQGDARGQARRRAPAPPLHAPDPPHRRLMPSMRCVLTAVSSGTNAGASSNHRSDDAFGQWCRRFTRKRRQEFRTPRRAWTSPSLPPLPCHLPIWIGTFIGVTFIGV